MEPCASSWAPIWDHITPMFAPSAAERSHMGKTSMLNLPANLRRKTPRAMRTFAYTTVGPFRGRHNATNLRISGGDW
jgi:hypothetical protein